MTSRQGALDAGREDLARLALECKNGNLVQMQSLDKQITELQEEGRKIEEAEKRMFTKVEEFKS